MPNQQDTIALRANAIGFAIVGVAVGVIFGFVFGAVFVGFFSTIYNSYFCCILIGACLRFTGEFLAEIFGQIGKIPTSLCCFFISDFIVAISSTLIGVFVYRLVRYFVKKYGDLDGLLNSAIVFIGQSALLADFARGNSNAHLFDNYSALRHMIHVGFNELRAFIWDDNDSNNKVVVADVIEAADDIADFNVIVLVETYLELQFSGSDVSKHFGKVVFKIADVFLGWIGTGFLPTAMVYIFDENHHT